MIEDGHRHGRLDWHENHDAIRLQHSMDKCNVTGTCGPSLTLHVSTMFFYVHVVLSFHSTPAETILAVYHLHQQCRSNAKRSYVNEGTHYGSSLDNFIALRSSSVQWGLDSIRLERPEHVQITEMTEYLQNPEESEHCLTKPDTTCQRVNLTLRNSR